MRHPVSTFRRGEHELSAAPPSAPTPTARALLALVRGYQLVISPWLGPRCRYLPTCSAYAAEALQRHGAWTGSRLMLQRLCRCHPWGASGFDPVPTERPRGWLGRSTSPHNPNDSINHG